MGKIEDLRAEYEEANAEAVKLSGEHQGKLDALVDRRQKLKDQYGDQFAEANQKAADAQAQLMAYEAAAALLERGDEGEQKLRDFTGKGGALLHEAYLDLKAQQD